jgi:hypothetical protein
MVVFAAALAGPFSAAEFGQGPVRIVDPWSRATPGAARTGVAFMEIRTVAGASDRLIGARSGTAAAVEVHSHAEEAGVMRMRRVDGVPIPEGQAVRLEPGGYHLMLIGLTKPLRQGETIMLTVIFEKAGEITIEAPVLAVGAAGPGSAPAGINGGKGSGSGSGSGSGAGSGSGTKHHDPGRRKG